MAKSMKPTAEDELKWQAESIVRDAIKKTPGYNKAVRQAMRDIKQTQKNAVAKLKGKK